MFISFAWVAKPCILTFIVAYHDATFIYFMAFKQPIKMTKPFIAQKTSMAFWFFHPLFNVYI
jgi:hypothetical protein